MSQEAKALTSCAVHTPRPPAAQFLGSQTLDPSRVPRRQARSRRTALLARAAAFVVPDGRGIRLLRYHVDSASALWNGRSRAASRLLTVAMELLPLLGHLTSVPGCVVGSVVG